MTTLDTIRYIDEKFSAGVHLMARSDAPLRERVFLAYEAFHPAFAFGDRDGIPEEVRREIAQLWARLTGAGGAVATLRAMSDGEVRRIAGAICDVHSWVSFARGLAENESETP